MLILTKIQFEVTHSNIFDFCENLINKLFSHFDQRYESERSAVQNLSNYIARSIMYSRDFLDIYYDPQDLAVAIVKVGVFAANQFFDEPIIQKLIEFIAVMEDFSILSTVGGERLEEDLKTYILSFRENFKNLTALQNFDDAKGFFFEIFN